MRKNLLFLLCICSLFQSCVSGTKADPNAVSLIREGQTTRDEVISLLGKPTFQTFTGNGGLLLNYNYFSEHYKGPLSTTYSTEFISVALNSSGIVEQVKFSGNDSKSNLFHMQSSSQYVKHR